jgi:hypothetical protein
MMSSTVHRVHLTLKSRKKGAAGDSGFHLWITPSFLDWFHRKAPGSATVRISLKCSLLLPTSAMEILPRIKKFENANNQINAKKCHKNIEDRRKAGFGGLVVRSTELQGDLNN